MRVFAPEGETRAQAVAPPRDRGQYDRRMNGRLAFALTVAALAWSVGFAAAVVPLLADESSAVLVPAAIPAAFAAAVWLVLRRRCTIGTSSALAWLFVALLWAFSVFSLASLGLFVLPVVALLGLATAFTPAAAAPRQPRG